MLSCQPNQWPETQTYGTYMAITGHQMIALSALIIILRELIDGLIKSPSRFFR